MQEQFQYLAKLLTRLNRRYQAGLLSRRLHIRLLAHVLAEYHPIEQGAPSPLPPPNRPTDDCDDLL